MAWRQEKREIASDLGVLQALVERMNLMLKTTSDPDLRDELREQLAELDSVIAKLRERYFV